jgi:hypothetical protein
VSEKLTDEERARLTEGLSQHVLITEPEIADVAKLLRIHDAQATAIKNLQFRLGMATADPDSQSARLISKHNALKMASEAIDRLQARGGGVRATKPRPTPRPHPEPRRAQSHL